MVFNKKYRNFIYLFIFIIFVSALYYLININEKFQAVNKYNYSTGQTRCKEHNADLPILLTRNDYDCFIRRIKSQGVDRLWLGMKYNKVNNNLEWDTDSKQKPDFGEYLSDTSFNEYYTRWKVGDKITIPNSDIQDCYIETIDENNISFRCNTDSITKSISDIPNYEIDNNQIKKTIPHDDLCIELNVQADPPKWNIVPCSKENRTICSVNNINESYTNVKENFKTCLPPLNRRDGDMWASPSNDRRTWMEAEQECKKINKHLAYIPNKEAEEELLNFARHNGINNKFWIGLNTKKNSDDVPRTWNDKWTNNRDLLYQESLSQNDLNTTSTSDQPIAASLYYHELENGRKSVIWEPTPQNMNLRYICKR